MLESVIPFIAEARFGYIGVSPFWVHLVGRLHCLGPGLIPATVDFPSLFECQFDALANWDGPIDREVGECRKDQRQHKPACGQGGGVNDRAPTTAAHTLTERRPEQ